MSGMVLTNSVINEETVEAEYGLKKGTQSYYRGINMPYHKIGKQYFYTRREVEAWIKSFDKNGKSNYKSE